MFRKVLVCALSLVLTNCIPKKTEKPAVPSGSNTPVAEVTPATQLGMIQSDLYQTPDACGVFTVEINDASAFSTIANKVVNVQLSTSSSTGHFYSDPECKEALTGLTFSADASQQSAYYKDSTASNATIKAQDKAAGGLKAAELTMHIQAVTQLGFSVSSEDAKINECISFFLISQDKDEHILSPAKDVEITLQSSSAKGTFHSDDTCTTAVGKVSIEKNVGYSSTIYYKDSTVGTSHLKAAETPSQSWKAAAFDLTISN